MLCIAVQFVCKGGFDSQGGCRKPDGSGVSKPQQEWLLHRLHEAQALGHAVVIAMHYAAVVSDTAALRQRSGASNHNRGTVQS